jgi:proline iminopeptidase
MRRYKLIQIICLVLLMTVACTQQRSANPLMIRETTASNEDVRLYVRVAGDPSSGNVLIAIHGGPGMTSDYMLNLEKLAGPDLAVVTYDQRGVGRSSSPTAEPGNYTLAKYAEDLETVRQAVDVEHIYIFGHSWGGIVAQRYATLYPNHVRSMILMGSGPPAWGQVRNCQDAIYQRVMELVQSGIIPYHPEPGSIEAEKNILPAYFSDPNFWFSSDDSSQAPQIDERTTQVNDLTWAANESYDLSADLAVVNFKVLNLWGDSDPVRSIASEAIISAMPNADLETIVLNQCGHFWHECPEQFFTAVDDFLGK